jgi:rod shape-determining protein MreC
MYRLFQFLNQYRAFLFFVLIETICIWLIVKNNNYQGAAFFNSSNRYAANILEVKTDIQDYFELKEVNENLAKENARLNQLLISVQQKKPIPSLSPSDSLRAIRYEFIAGKVINNSTAHYNNFMTLDKGTLDGMKPGMGVISTNGVVGRINQCSDHFCTAISILSKDHRWSAKVKGKGIDCFVGWNESGFDPKTADLLNIPRHKQIAKGDTVVTSGFNRFFPEGIMIGKIKSFEPEGGSFLKATIELSTDFTSLSYVYAISNKMEAELDTLENKNNPKDHQ